MRKFFLFFVLTSVICSCKEKEQTVVAENNPVAFADLDLEHLIDYEQYGNAGPTVYAIREMPKLQNEELAEWVKQFNGWAYTYNLASISDQFERSCLNGEFPAALIDSVKAFKMDALLAADAKVTLTALRDRMASQMTGVQCGAVELDDYWPKAEADSNGTTLNRVVRQLVPEDESKLYETMDLIKSWKSPKEEWRTILTCENQDETFAKFVAMMDSAESFDDQCKMALWAGKYIYDARVTTMMYTLLQSENYSESLFALWFAWRSLAQISYYGRSRDSVIADPLFNQGRRSAFLTVLRHLDQHPDDVEAVWQLAILCQQSNIVRSGSCIYGNDANLDVMYVYDDEEDEQDHH